MSLKRKDVDDTQGASCADIGIPSIEVVGGVIMGPEGHLTEALLKTSRGHISETLQRLGQRHPNEPVFQTV